MSKHLVYRSALAAMLSGLVANGAYAAVIGQLTTYQPQPTSDADAEFLFDGITFTHGPGALGNGDGELAVALQTAPGLQFNADFTVPGAIPGSVINVGGSTDFYDATMLLSGLSVSAPAALIPLPGVTQVVQPLGAGAFEVYSTDPVGPGLPTLLLSGVVSDAVITGFLGSSSGATLSASVTYTGGAIWTASGFASAGGAFSWSLVGIEPPLTVGPGGFLEGFAANATGLFDAVVPEPSAALGMSLGGLALLRRRRD